jgi:beta-N-acetylhexosaminidase
MSDQSSAKPSLNDASKSFAIPSRPSARLTHGPQAPSWEIADQQESVHGTVAQEELPAAQEPVSLPEDRSTPSELTLQQAEAQAEPKQFERSVASFSWAVFEQKQPPSELPPASPQTFGRTPTLEQPALRPLHSSPPPLPSTEQEHTQRYQRSNPVALLAARGRTPRGRRILYIGLAIIAVIVVIGGLLSQQLLNGNGVGGAQNSALVFSGNGPYVRLPLTDKQINAIQHLAGHMKYKALASLYVSHMSLDDEIGQLIMVEYNQPDYSSDLDYMINTLHVGGVIMYEFQMTSASQTKGDIAHMQQRANIPLLISTDEEGGPYVHRLSNIYGYRMSATQIEESGSLDVAKQQGLKTSKDLAALGLNEDLAPDVDVNQVNGYDMVTRTFGNTPGQVIQYAGAYLQAMQGNGTIACIKHFPGLGGALTDAHKGLPVVNSTRQQIYDIDLAPFKAFIQSPNALLNPGMIMPTDVLLPAIDPKYPAELSHTFMTDILRNEFGYDGVTLTDALYMQGITDTWDMYTASVMALQAGNDMLLGANGTDQTLGVINAIKQALQNGQLTKARIDESVARIIALKMQYHLMPTYIPET